MPTANESPPHPAVSPTAELHLIREQIQAVLAAEQASLKQRAAAIQQAMGAARKSAESTEASLRGELHHLATRQEAALHLLETRIHARRERLQAAAHRARTQLTERCQKEKDRRVASTQAERIQRRKDRHEQASAARSQLEQLRQALGQDRAERLALRKSALSGLGGYRWTLGRPIQSPQGNPPPAASPESLRALSLRELEAARGEIARLRKRPLVALFRYLPATALILATLVTWHFLLRQNSGPLASPVFPAAVSAAIAALWSVGWLQTRPLAARIASHLAACREAAQLANQSASAPVHALEAELQNSETAEDDQIQVAFQAAEQLRQQELAEGRANLEARLERATKRLERLTQSARAQLAQRHENERAALQATADQSTHASRLTLENAQSAACAEHQARVASLLPDWQQGPLAALQSLATREEATRPLFPPWTPETCSSWTPPVTTPRHIRLGSLRIDPPRLAGNPPDDPRLALPTPFAAAFEASFPHHASLLLEQDSASGRELAAITLRLLASFPPGRASFIFIDPSGLGRDFAGLMHLADHEESLIHHRIWTQPAHIEERLAELNEHMEKVIQMYLRNEFATLAEYNERAGAIAEKHRFLVIAGFPAGFSDTALKRLLPIASSGARCGVHLILGHDLRQPSADPALLDELRRNCLVIRRTPDGGLRLADAPPGADELQWDTPPSPEDESILIHRIGRAAVDSNRVELPFSHIAPPPDQRWSLDTSEELVVPIGRTGASKLQSFRLGKGTRQHALVAGKTGSGKSTLFHVLITNLALWCRPDQVEFHLIDFKKGVEFKCYAEKRLPHARVVAIESDRGFALSVLRHVDAELRRRGECFRQAGCQDLPGYLRSPQAQPMPRSLLLIDEFQEFFTEDDAIAQESSLLLDRIVRQGRAFGIHVVLGSQTLGGAYTLARATLGQMVVRVALQCNEADAALIMEDDNPAPRLLNRPGEGIYNDQAGAVAANSPFQIVWLPEQERDACLDIIRTLARKASPDAEPPSPFVFEGSAPADVRENAELAALLARPSPTASTAGPRIWLGAPQAIAGHTEARFPKQNGSHMLVVGQSAERNLALLTVALTSLACQFRPGEVEFLLLESSPETSRLAATAARLGHTHRTEGPAGLAQALAQWAEEIGSPSPTRFLLIPELHRFKALRPDDEFRFSLDEDDAAPSASRSLNRILDEGGPAGIHVLACLDTWNNVSRWIPRKLLSEFDLRVLFQMSATDSANLIDAPDASSLGLHRALLHQESLGTRELFRPYSLPDPDWPPSLPVPQAQFA